MPELQTLFSPCHLLRPEALWLLVPLVLLLWLWHGRRGRVGQWQQVCDPALLPHILIGREQKPARWPLFVIGLGGLLAILALTGPACEQREQPVFRDQSALVIALDLSRSMDAADLAPSRLTRARLKLIDILNQRREGQTALLVYAADAYIVSPLTQDTATIIAQVNSLNSNLLPQQGSRAPIAIAKAVDLLRQAGSVEGDILLISDGVAANQVDASLAALAGTHHRLSVLAVGTASGAPIAKSDGGFLTDSQGAIVIPKLDSSSLQQLAQQGGGRFALLSTDDSDITHLLTRLEQQASATTESLDLRSDRWQEEGPWLLLALLPLAALAFRRGYLAVLPFAVLIALPQPSEANDANNLWLTPDQQAAQALEAGDAAQAAELFVDPRWRAAAHYRAGHFDKAAEALEGLNDTEALYNRGNALARQGEFEQALAAYEQALEQQPQHEDAEHNRDLIKQMLQQQSQQDQSSSQEQEGEDQGQGDGEQQQDQAGQSQQNQQGETGEQSSADQQGQAGSEQAQQETQADGSEAQEGEQQEAQQAEAAQEEGQEGEQDTEQRLAEQKDEQNGEAEQQSQKAQSLSPDELSKDETERMTQQWLRRIPDDPGGLLRRKFQYQYQQQQHSQDEIEPW